MQGSDAGSSVIADSIFVALLSPISTEEITIQQNFVFEQTFPCEVLYLCCVNSVVSE